MVGIFFSILSNIITLYMPRSGRWRIFVAHDFVGVQILPTPTGTPKAFRKAYVNFAFKFGFVYKKKLDRKLSWDRELNAYLSNSL